MIFPSPFFSKTAVAGLASEVTYTLNKALADINIISDSTSVLGVLADTGVDEGTYMRFDVSDPENISITTEYQNGRFSFAKTGAFITAAGSWSIPNYLYIATAAELVKLDITTLDVTLADDSFGIGSPNSDKYPEQLAYGYIGIYATNTQNVALTLFWDGNPLYMTHLKTIDPATGNLSGNVQGAYNGSSPLPPMKSFPESFNSNSLVLTPRVNDGIYEIVLAAYNTATWGRTAPNDTSGDIIEFQSYRLGSTSVIYTVDRTLNQIRYIDVSINITTWNAASVQLSGSAPTAACFYGNNNQNFYITILRDDSTIDIYLAQDTDIRPVLYQSIDISASLPAGTAKKVSYLTKDYLVISGLGKLITWKL